MTKLERVNPFADQGVSEQLDSWAAALEMAVATLNQTLAEVRQYQEKGVADDRPEEDDATGDEGRPDGSP